MAQLQEETQAIILQRQPQVVDTQVEDIQAADSLAVTELRVIRAIQEAITAEYLSVIRMAQAMAMVMTTTAIS
jgi:hypothetical protein